ncbi:MAG: glycosyltransferase WbuB [Aquabacterium sp.]|uniref:glycosyltransferase WbuB n=1 Tax=Aquabacterium sp. TaxID=1872578 RepID=UPI001D1E3786|nr:glycosyltransferase WbuB [Aquabacterium sp.]MBT9609766.1 glycosyltransferase WbuB [Aquabacterium sp.]
MKILIYSANFAPEPTGIGKYSGEMAEWLATQGHDVRVVAAPPYYPAWRLGDGYAWPPYRKETWRGCTVWRAPLWVPSQPNGLSRIVHLLTFALSSAPVMLRQLAWRPDVVLVVAPAMVCAPMAWVTARLSGAQAWLHVQDFEVDVAFRMGLVNVGLARHLVWRMERWLLRSFDVVSTISGRMIDHLQKKGVSPERCHLFPNWVDTDKIRPLDGISSYRARLGIPAQAVVALFSGTMGSKQGLEVVPAAARLLQHRDDIHFVICGDGVMKPQIEADTQGLARVHLLPLQDVAMLPELLGLADIHLLPQSPDAEDLVLPSKLTGMLSSGRPIVATCNPDTEIAMVVAGCGKVVPPLQPEALAQAIESLADDPNARAQLGQAARQYAEEEIGRDAVLSAVVRHMQAPDAPADDRSRKAA